MIYQLTPTGGQYVISPEELRQSGPLAVRPSDEHDPTTRAHAAQSLAEQFLEARRVKHGDLRMEADDGGGNDGGQDDGADDDQQDGQDGQDGQDDGADKLGDPGKQALDRMKSERNAARTELRAFKALGLTPDQIKALQKPADDGDKPDVDKIREQARTEARTEAQRERVVDKIEAKARKFADPEDAVAILLRSHDADDFLDGDKIDVEAIQEALDDLLEKKPHLAAAQGGRRFQGSADGGARKESRPDQLTRDDLKRMSPRQIEEARKAGRLNDLLGIKS